MTENCMVAIEGKVCGKQAVATYTCVIGFPNKKDEIHDIHVCDKHKRQFVDKNI